ncbi:replication factor C subunit 2 [Saccharomycopsis crataegensis]|uniref:Replication factor C subunit 2 n=1 Tax=Saccharomycopsis crataegensis TaxID=43959 RepID=A0AAV5QIX7_9ASCO|nr:replication factor C subunit 2 [Saccharomycopsis crataegensis]
MSMASFFNQRAPKKASSKDDGDRKARMPWVEKYRPKNLDDVSSQSHAVTVLKKSLHTSNLPHMLFYGPPGTGKTSTILALAKQLYGPELYKTRVLELNASDERGISIVREKVKNFARLTVSNPSKEDLAKYPCPPYKIIILDEADSMTNDAQSALRRTMETYSGVTRFCLICNYITRIIDPLASRCSKFRFKPLDNTDALTRLTYVANEEKVQYEDGVLEKILDISHGDLRKAITFLQSATKLHGVAEVDADGDISIDEQGGNNHESSKITVTSVQEIAGIVSDSTLDEIVTAARTHDFQVMFKLSKKLAAEGWSATQMLDQLHDKLILDDSLTGTQKIHISFALNETDDKLSNGTDEQIQFLNFLSKLSQVL